MCRILISIEAKTLFCNYPTFLEGCDLNFKLRTLHCVLLFIFGDCIKFSSMNENFVKSEDGFIELALRLYVTTSVMYLVNYLKPLNYQRNIIYWTIVHLEILNQLQVSDCNVHIVRLSLEL
jgi:hypothetical protein